MVTKMLYLMRHGKALSVENNRWEPDIPLSHEVRDCVARVRSAHLQAVCFTQLLCSPYKRARETAEIAVPSGNWRVSNKLAPLYPGEWEHLLREKFWDKEPTLGEMLEVNPRLVEEQFEICREVAHAMLYSLEIGQKALCVSHEPLLHMMWACLDEKHEWRNPSEKILPGAIVVIHIHDSRQITKGHAVISELINPPIA